MIYIYLNYKWCRDKYFCSLFNRKKIASVGFRLKKSKLKNEQLHKHMNKYWPLYE